MGKFNNVPVDEGTKIIFEQEASLGEYEVLYQKWFWDGITAESIIFSNEDIAELTDKEVEEEVKTSPLLNSDSNVTFKRCDSGFTFVNFNFETK